MTSTWELSQRALSGGKCLHEHLCKRKTGRTLNCLWTQINHQETDIEGMSTLQEIYENITVSNTASGQHSIPRYHVQPYYSMINSILLQYKVAYIKQLYPLWESICAHNNPIFPL